ncbi:MAG: YflK [Paenibacillus sp.]|jgi:MOSC domain-containing protein YiiM|nr:YflK [Paenibacillus sp.]
MRVVSLNVGKPQPMHYEGGVIETGIGKEPAAAGLVALTATQLEGDGQADRINHGGPDKAVCVYAFEHYSYWERELHRKLAYGAFGENLTVLGLTEDQVCIGDIYSIGDVVLQVSQPRQPCHKLAKKYNLPDLPARVQQTGYTGFYFRVLQTGMLDRSLPFVLEQRHPLGITIDFANDVKYRDKRNRTAIQAMLANEALSESWRVSFQNRLTEDKPQ